MTKERKEKVLAARTGCQKKKYNFVFKRKQEGPQDQGQGGYVPWWERYLTLQYHPSIIFASGVLGPTNFKSAVFWGICRILSPPVPRQLDTYPIGGRWTMDPTRRQAIVGLLGTFASRNISKTKNRFPFLNVFEYFCRIGVVSRDGDGG